MKLSKRNKRRYNKLGFSYKDVVMAEHPHRRNRLMRSIFELPKKPIRPHIKNTARVGKEQFFFIFDIKRVLGCKRRVITFDSEGHKERFTQKGNQVRLK
jgi:hypothetical protein